MIRCAWERLFQRIFPFIAPPPPFLSSSLARRLSKINGGIRARCSLPKFSVLPFVIITPALFSFPCCQSTAGEAGAAWMGAHG